MVKYFSSVILVLICCPRALALDKNRPIKHKVGAEVILDKYNEDEIRIYYEVKKETDEYAITIELESKFKASEERTKIKVEVEF